MRPAITAKSGNTYYYGIDANACTFSKYFDADWYTGSEGGGKRVTNICDRVPPGRYTVVRDRIALFNSFGSGDELSEMGYSARVNYRMRGLIFNLGNDDSYDDIAGHIFPFAPSTSFGDNDWQRVQSLLSTDSTWVNNPTNAQFYGNQSLRDQYMVLGAFFTLGNKSFNNPKKAGEDIAELVNRFGLDFVVVDVSDGTKWNKISSGGVLTSLLFHAEINFIRPPTSSIRPRISSHKPIFVVTPLEALSNMISTDGTFEPFVNGTIGSMVFPAPKLPANGGYDEVNKAYEWAKPSKGYYPSMSAPQCYIDVRSYGSSYPYDNTVTMVGYMTDKNIAGGFAKSFPTVNKNMAMNSGLVIFDDFATVINSGGMGLGRSPVKHWDFRTSAPVEYLNLSGNIVPSWSPDPIQDPIVGISYANEEYGGLLLELENWKNGSSIDLKIGLITYRDINLPNRIEINSVNCPPYKKITGSWIKFDDLWISTGEYVDPLTGRISSGVLADKYVHALSGDLIKFNGTPLEKDEGKYPMLIEVSGSQLGFRTAHADANRTQIFLMLNVKQKKETNIALQGTDYLPNLSGTGSSHSTSSFSTERIPYNWYSSEKWCGYTPTSSLSDPTYFYQGNYRFGTPDVIEGTAGLACGSLGLTFYYRAEHIETIIDYSQNFGLGGVDNLYKTTNGVAEYGGFIFATMYKLSEFNPDYTMNNGFGLLNIKPDEYYDQFNLLRASYNLNVGMGLLDKAWKHANNSTYGCTTYEARVRHAFTYFTSWIGTYPNAHNDVGACPGSGNASVEYLMNSVPRIENIANCVKNIRNSGSYYGPNDPTQPGSGGGSGTGTIIPPGQTMAGCPVSLGQFNKTDGCQEHINRGGGNPPAIDLAPKTLDAYALLSPCNGKVVLRYLDPRTKWTRDVRAAGGSVNNIIPGYCYEGSNKTIDQTEFGIGNVIVVRCDDGDQYLFAHLDDRMFTGFYDPVTQQTLTYNEIYNESTAATVFASQPIGIVGDTGCSTGPHVHIEYWPVVISSGTRYAYDISTTIRFKYTAEHGGDYSNFIVNGQWSYSREYEQYANYDHNTAAAARCFSLPANCP